MTEPGSSIGGTTGGLAYEYAAWPGLVAFVVALLLVALACAVLLRRTPARQSRRD